MRLVRQGRYLHHWLIVNASCSSILNCYVLSFQLQWIDFPNLPKLLIQNSVVLLHWGADNTASLEFRIWRKCVDVHLIGDQPQFSGNFQEGFVKTVPALDFKRKKMNLRQLTAALPSDDARRSPAAELAMVTAMQHLVFAALDSGINNRQQGCVFWLANFFNAESTYWSNQWMIKQLQYPQLNDPQFFFNQDVSWVCASDWNGVSLTPSDVIWSMPPCQTAVRCLAATGGTWRD